MVSVTQLSSINHRQEFLAGQRIGPEAPEHPAGHEVRIGLVHATRGDAMMRPLYDYTNAARFQDQRGILAVARERIGAALALIMA
jgi:hypothetical protein